MTIITAPRSMRQPEGEKDHSPEPRGPLAISVTKTAGLGARGGGEQCPRSFWPMSGCSLSVRRGEPHGGWAPQARSLGIPAPWQPGAPAVTASPLPGTASLCSPGTVPPPAHGVSARRLCHFILSLRDAFRGHGSGGCAGLPLQGRSAWLTAPVPRAVMCPASRRYRGAVRAEASRAHVTGDSLLGHVAMMNVGRTWDLNVIGHVVRSTDGVLPGSGLPAMSSAV